MSVTGRIARRYITTRAAPVLSPTISFPLYRVSRKADIELGEGGHFGELNLLTGRPSIANVTVLTPKARLMAVTKKDYKKR